MYMKTPKRIFLVISTVLATLLLFLSQNPNAYASYVPQGYKSSSPEGAYKQPLNITIVEVAVEKGIKTEKTQYGVKAVQKAYKTQKVLINCFAPDGTTSVLRT